MTDLNQQGWQFVYLERRNLLRAAISNYIAAQHQRYFLRRDDDLELPITTIDPDKLLELLVWYQQINRQEAQIMATLPHIKLIYEEDLLHTSHHQPALDRIFEFLDIAPAQVRARSRRTSSDDIAGYVQNHEELLAFIAQTEFAEYLEGE